MATKNNGERVASGKEKKSLAKVHQDIAKAEAAAPTWEQFPEEMTGNLPVLAAEYLGLNADIARMEKRKKEISDEVKAIQALTGEPMITGDFFVSEMITSHKPRKLDERKLLEGGVAMDIIEASYSGGEAYEYLKIRAKD